MRKVETLDREGTSVGALADELERSGIRCLREEPLSRYTTLGLGGPAELLVRPGSSEELATALERARAEGVPVRVLGAGSNLIVGPRGVRGMVLHTGSLDFVRFEGETSVVAGSGVHFPALVRQTAARGLRGLEAGVGIPGSLGGVLTMNAGAYDFSIGPLVEHVEAVSLETGLVTLPREKIDFRYRASSFGSELIVATVRLALRRDDPKAIKADVDRHMRFRKETQPVGVKSAGCIFKNPEGESAGRLIDRLGLKGFRVGGARISEVHANFIVHGGAATAEDVLSLIDAVRDRVARDAGVTLETEVMTWI